MRIKRRKFFQSLRHKLLLPENHEVEEGVNMPRCRTCLSRVEAVQLGDFSPGRRSVQIIARCHGAEDSIEVELPDNGIPEEEQIRLVLTGTELFDPTEVR